MLPAKGLDWKFVRNIEILTVTTPVKFVNCRKQKGPITLKRRHISGNGGRGNAREQRQLEECRVAIVDEDGPGMVGFQLFCGWKGANNIARSVSAAEQYHAPAAPENDRNDPAADKSKTLAEGEASDAGSFYTTQN